MQKNIIHAGLSARQMIHTLHVVEPEHLGDSNPDGPEKHVKIVLNPTRPKLYDLFIDKSQSGPKRPRQGKSVSKFVRSSRSELLCVRRLLLYV
jgi:hypothetical protein